MIKTNSLTAELPYAHYSESVWNRAQLVFEDSTIVCNQSGYYDRLYEHDWEKHMKADAKAKEVYPTLCAGRFEVYLQEYFNNPNIRIGKVYTGCNQSSGYQYWAFEWAK